MKPFIRNDHIEGQGKSVLVFAKHVNMRISEVDRMFYEFEKFESKATHTADIPSIFGQTSLKYSLFDSVLFQIFDKSKCGKFKFVDYLIFMWVLLSATHDHLAQLCFDSFDINQ